MGYRMTPTQIKRNYRKEAEKLEQLFLCGKLSRERYDEEIHQLDVWATEHYDANFLPGVLEYYEAQQDC